MRACVRVCVEEARGRCDSCERGRVRARGAWPHGSGAVRWWLCWCASARDGAACCVAGEERREAREGEMRSEIGARRFAKHHERRISKAFTSDETCGAAHAHYLHWLHTSRLETLWDNGTTQLSVSSPHTIRERLTRSQGSLTLPPPQDRSPRATRQTSAHPHILSNTLCSIPPPPMILD